MGSEYSSRAATVMTAAVIGAACILSAQCLKAQEPTTDIARMQQGYAIAPVSLNVSGKDLVALGLGSCWVNSIGACNGCHSSGTAASLGIYPYLPGRNPYFNQPTKIDPTVNLNGGVNFLTVGTPTGPYQYAGPNIITRNLTPNFAGVPEGGRTLEQFTRILRTGVDLDHIHPTCTQTQLDLINNPGDLTQAELPAAVNNCIPTGVIPGTDFDNEPDGNLLQIMPWASFTYLTDYDIQSIYTYLSAIPCIDNTTSTPPAGAPDELLNNCGPGEGPSAEARPPDNASRSTLKPGGSRAAKLSLRSE
jgi:hypothetical protein